MLIQERMSGRSVNDIENLNARFKTRLIENHHLNTFKGYVLLLVYAIKNLYFFPSTYLARKSREGLCDYVNNISQVRLELLNVEQAIREGLSPRTHDIKGQLRNGQMFEFRVQTSHDNCFFYLKNDDNEWELQSFTHRDLLNSIEKDIENNPELFDSRLAASLRLRSAAQIITNSAIVSGDDLLPRLTTPGSQPYSEFVMHIEEIASDLLSVGCYDDLYHPDEPSFNKLAFATLGQIVALFNARNLDHLLFGQITTANRDEVAKTIRILNELLLRDRLTTDVRDKLLFIEKCTKQHLGKVSLGNDAGTLMLAFFKRCRENIAGIKKDELALAQKIINALPRDTDPAYPIPAATLDCYAQLRTELSELMTMVNQQQPTVTVTQPPTT